IAIEAPSGQVERIANSVDRADEIRLGTGLGDLPAEVPDMAVDGAVVHDASIVVETVEKLVARENRPRTRGEGVQQPELDRGQIQFRAVDRRLHPLRIDRQALAGLAYGLAARSAQQRLDTRDQLARAEGFADVVVGAEVEPEETVDLVDARGDHDDRDVAEA